MYSLPGKMGCSILNAIQKPDISCRCFSGRNNLGKRKIVLKVSSVTMLKTMQVQEDE